MKGLTLGLLAVSTLAPLEGARGSRGAQVQEHIVTVLIERGLSFSHHPVINVYGAHDIGKLGTHVNGPPKLRLSWIPFLLRLAFVAILLVGGCRPLRILPVLPVLHR